MKNAVIRLTLAAGLSCLAACQTLSTASTSQSPPTPVNVVVGFSGNCPTDPLKTNCPSWVGNSAACLNLKNNEEIHWVKASAAPRGADFTIDFDQGSAKHEVCDTADPDLKKCQPKKRSDYTYNGAKALVFKYTLAGTDPSCRDKKIDPYIIVLK